MSKAIVRINIPDDYADEYKEWIIDGRLCYLEDGAWTFLKEVEYKVEPYRDAILIERIKKIIDLAKSSGHRRYAELLSYLIEDWEKENAKADGR